MRKEMLFADGLDQHEVYSNLERLQKVKFNRIKIPDFTVKWDGNLLVLETEFIKGNHVRSIADYNIVFDELVLGDSEYGFDSYQPNNFIVSESGYVYPIDLDNYRHFTPDQRLKKWETTMGFWGHIVESYRGSKQLQVKIYGHGHSQSKLKKLVEGMFNANIECGDLPPEFYGDFYCKIGGETYDNLLDAMNCLKSLYIETRNEIELDGLPKHYHKPKKSSALFDSNNRTEHIG